MIEHYANHPHEFNTFAEYLFYVIQFAVVPGILLTLINSVWRKEK